jgi:hypothetical protein
MTPSWSRKIKLAPAREDVAQLRGQGFPLGGHAEKEGEHGGNGDEGARLRFSQSLEEILQGEESGEKGLRESPDEGQDTADRVAEGMEVGQHVHEDPASVTALHGFVDALRVVVEIAVGQGNRLRRTRSAGGGEDHRHIGILFHPVPSSGERRYRSVGGRFHGGYPLCPDRLPQGFHPITEDHAERVHMVENFQDPFRSSSGIQRNDGAAEPPGRHGQMKHQRTVGQKRREAAAGLESSAAEGFRAEGGLSLRLSGILPDTFPPEHRLGRIPGKPVRNLLLEANGHGRILLFSQELSG